MAPSEWDWRPSAGPGARSPGEQEAFLVARAREGLTREGCFGVRARRQRGDPLRPLASQRRSSDALSTALRQSLADDALEAACSPAPPTPHTSPLQLAWTREREASVSTIFSALRSMTSKPEDRLRLARGLRGVQASFDLAAAFPGRQSVTAEELRREMFRRIVIALQSHTGLGHLRRPPAPRADDFEAMAAAFPSQQRVAIGDCWWTTPSAQPPPESHDVRRPPISRRSPTMRAGGVYTLHCRDCRRHDKAADGSWLDENAHWNCPIHQLLFDLCGVRLPFLPGARPTTPLIVEQIIERDPVKAAAAEAIIAAALDKGLLVYAAPDEPLITVPTAVVEARSLRLCEAELAVTSNSPQAAPDVRLMLPLAAHRSVGFVAAVAALSEGLPVQACRGNFRTVLNSNCGAVKHRLISLHNEGCNPLCVSTPMSYPTVEELAGHARPGWTYMMNDNEGAFVLLRSTVRINLAFAFTTPHVAVSS